jgi:hypothetical protein
VCIENLVLICKKRGIREISFPKSGSGMDKLDLIKIITYLNKSFIDQRIKCHVYTNAILTHLIRENDLSINQILKKLQVEDKEVAEMIGKTKEKKMKGFFIEEEVLLKIRKGRNGRIFKQLVVPKVLREEIFEMCHDSFTGAHLGQKKTLLKLSNRFYWPS